MIQRRVLLRGRYSGPAPPKPAYKSPQQEAIDKNAGKCCACGQWASRIHCTKPEGALPIEEMGPYTFPLCLTCWQKINIGALGERLPYPQVDANFRRLAQQRYCQ